MWTVDENAVVQEGRRRGVIPELEQLQQFDERSRQIAGLYAAEKARADALGDALAGVVREISSVTGGSLADLVTAINKAERVLEKFHNQKGTKK